MFCSLYANAQNTTDFKKDFKAAIDSKITNSLADSLMKKHYSSLLWFYDGSLDVIAYPLKEMRNEGLYKNNINQLFADTARSVKTLACLMAASTNDTSKINEIKDALKYSKYKNMFAATSLIVLGDNDLSQIIKCIIANDFNETVYYLTLMFLQTDKTELEKFARDSLFSDDKAVQYLAVKAMGEISPNPKNEEMLREAVLKYDLEMKGWAIAALEHYKAKNMFSLVKPYLNNSQLKQVSLRALAKSTSEEDVNYLNQMLLTEQVDRNFWEALLNSENEIHVKSWLSSLKKRKLPVDYYIYINKNEMIKNDVYFDDICEIISTSKNKMQVYSLMKYFEGRKDKKATDFLTKCLTHPLLEIQDEAKQLLAN